MYKKNRIKIPKTICPYGFLYLESDKNSKYNARTVLAKTNTKISFTNPIRIILRTSSIPKLAVVWDEIKKQF
ncbi:hypothetical protein [Chryseobacterium binzhouense]|uniref:hypothetical protein n=1 Tax=Chryseobacterium binzhouense TaxID=2593646 RepID=UPI0028963B95|nr:hypothetical protein [Chryseobacterium binzhouense]